MLDIELSLYINYNYFCTNAVGLDGLMLLEKKQGIVVFFSLQVVRVCQISFSVFQFCFDFTLLLELIFEVCI